MGYVRVYFGAHSFILFVLMFIFLLVLCCFDYGSFAASFEFERDKISNFVYLRFFEMPHGFYDGFFSFSREFR